MKSAKALVASGAVIESKVDGKVYQGLVVAQGKTYKTGLKLLGGSKADNLCTCLRSRREGVICEHALAVALALPRDDKKDSPSQKVATPPVSDNSTDPVELSKLYVSATDSSSSWPEIRDAGSKDGLPVELRLILPLHFAQSLAIGTAIQVGVEARILDEIATNNKSRNLHPGKKGHKLDCNNWQMAPYVLEQRSYFCASPGQSDLWDLLRQLSPSAPPSFLSLSCVLFSELVAACLGQECLLVGKKFTLKILSIPAQPKVVALEQAQGLRLSTKSEQTFLVDCEPPLVFEEDRVQVLPPNFPADIAKKIASANVVAWSEVAPILKNLDQNLSFANPENIPPLVCVQPQFTFLLSGSLQQLNLEVQIINHVKTGKKVCLSPGACSGIAWVHCRSASLSDAVIHFISPESLESVAQKLWRFGFRPISSGNWQIDNEPDILTFFTRYKERLASLGQLTFYPTIKRRVEELQIARPNFDFYRETPSARETNWMVFKCDFKLDSGERIGRAELQRLLNGGTSRVRRRNGKLLILDTELAEDLHFATAESGATTTDDGLVLTNRNQIEYFKATLAQLGYEVKNKNASDAFFASHDQALRDRLDHLEKNWPAKLREYQRDGILWLLSKLLHDRGAMLADEMGLGKTLQALVVAELTSYPVLVVCPASLTLQWQDEAKRFLPHRKCLVLGKDNILHPIQNKQDVDIYIASYGITREYAARLKNVSFAGGILDEAQFIRNPQSKTRRYLQQFRFSWKLAMTGTPIENRVADLWSLLDWLFPGRLGSLSDFTAHYGISAAKSEPGVPDKPSGWDATACRRLSARIAPMMLRRSKDDVLCELPQRTTQVIPCFMTDDQRAMYAQIAQEAAAQISLSVLPRQRLLALTALLRLRQVALSPSLLALDQPEANQLFSGSKLDALFAILSELQENKRKALIYSSFKSALILLKRALDARGIESSLLHGSTLDRNAEIKKFKTDPSVFVFLISLKAGGTGLNLTEADTVVHMEPWWNPAVEEQASARVHRIGQNRPVHIYKFITKDSVEEGILEIQRRKGEVAQAILGADGSNAAAMDGLSNEELAELLGLSRD